MGIPRVVADKLYLEIENAKVDRYGGIFNEIDKQIEYCNGQFDTIEIIEKWLSTLYIREKNELKAKEYILCSAVWYKDFDSNYADEIKEQSRPMNIDKGIVFCGQRHLQCIRTFSYVTGKKSVEGGEYEQGFLTNTNRFISREEGGQIAFNAGQTNVLKKTLYSEDLY